MIRIGLEDDNGKILFEIKSEPIGQLSGSEKKDFYVYEWFVKETGEIFYVGKGRGNRYKEFHQHAYVAEKIRKLFETGYRFVGEDMTEAEAIELESSEMTRILNDTNNRLTNRFIPLDTKRDNGYSKCSSTPNYEFEKAPCFYATEIDAHYFGTNCRIFDFVELDNLSVVSFINKTMSHEVIKIVYGDNYDKYYDEAISGLESCGSKILRSKYAKSVTAWIYSDDDDVYNYEIDQKHAKEILGRNVPVYHLIDVCNFLKKQNPCEDCRGDNLIINPIHDRVPLREIKNVYNSEKGYDEGYPYWEKGEQARKNKKMKAALYYYDKARLLGYDAPVLYDSYAKVYRQLRDYENEIDILDEAINRNVSNNNLSFKIRKRKACELLISSRLKMKENEDRMHNMIRNEKEKVGKTLGGKQSRGRSIIQFSDEGTLVKEYNSISMAVKETGINSKSIRDAANGIQKHAGGFKWLYKE